MKTTHAQINQSARVRRLLRLALLLCEKHSVDIHAQLKHAKRSFSDEVAHRPDSDARKLCVRCFKTLDLKKDFYRKGEYSDGRPRYQSSCKGCFHKTAFGWSKEVQDGDTPVREEKVAPKGISERVEADYA